MHFRNFLFNTLALVINLLQHSIDILLHSSKENCSNCTRFEGCPELVLTLISGHKSCIGPWFRLISGQGKMLILSFRQFLPGLLCVQNHYDMSSFKKWYIAESFKVYKNTLLFSNVSDSFKQAGHSIFIKK